jgi:putative hemolysin
MQNYQEEKNKFLFWFSLIVCVAIVVAFWGLNFQKMMKGFFGEPNEIQAAAQEWQKTNQIFSQMSQISQTLAAKNNNASEVSTQAVAQGMVQELKIEKKEPSLPTTGTQQNSKKTSSKNVSTETIYCVQNGGQSVERKNSLGKNYQVCVFDDKTECGVNEFYKGTCQKGDYIKWQDAADKLPDLIIKVEKAGYCNSMSNPIIWTENSGAYYCFQNISIQNIGLTKAETSNFLVAGKYIAIPQLASNQSYTLPKPYFVRVISKTSPAILEIDAKKEVRETNENNNIYKFPEQ